MESINLSKDNILKKLIPKINQLRNYEINSHNNLSRDIYSEVYINWCFILYDLIKINLDQIIKIQTIEDLEPESNNILLRMYKINNPYLNNNLDKLLDVILKQANSDNYNNIIENSPELSCFINSEKFINSQNKLNFEIKKILLEEFKSNSY
jgi:hypothetical protein